MADGVGRELEKIGNHLIHGVTFDLPSALGKQLFRQQAGRSGALGCGQINRAAVPARARVGHGIESFCTRGGVIVWRGVPGITAFQRRCSRNVKTETHSFGISGKLLRSQHLLFGLEK